jgi:alpha-glucosidase (family GH31 glycosyl hydrolase)
MNLAYTPSMGVHLPFGDEHPYAQSRNERIPRYPLADQAVTIGIQSDAAAVSVLWSGDGVLQPPIAAQPVLEQEHCWQAEIPPQAAGVTVSYTIVCNAEQYGPFSYCVAGWQQESAGIVWEQIRQGVWEGHIRADASHSGNVPLSALSVERLHGDTAATRRVRVTFDSPTDEAFYGFGERFNALDQRGEILDVRCFEEYKNQGKRTYIPMPWFVSSRGYGLYLETSRYVVYDLAASAQDRWSFEAEVGPAGDLKLMLFTSPDLQDLIGITGLFSDYVGKPAPLPDWAFGPWMSGNEWNSQARVLEEVEQTIQHDIPATVLVIEAWSDESTFYIWNDAQYSPKPGSESFRYDDFAFPPEGKWPNPKAMIDHLHELGIKVLLWQVPAFKKLDHSHPQHEADETHFIEKGYGVHETDGSLYKIRPFWFRGGMVWDVTNPQAREWWLNKRAYLLDDLKIDGFKTDGGEHLWGYGLRFTDGRSGDEVWNEYTLLYTTAYHKFAKRRCGEALTFSRAGFTGAQRCPAHWAGDENSTWDAFKHSILAGLSAGISGIPFWSWDIGGFSGEIPTAELFLRATAMAAFCPIMQYHAEYNDHRIPRRDRTPWNIQERTGHPDVISIYRYYANLRMNLMPYILQEAQYCVETGQPMMRALALAYSNDPECRRYPYEYLFGRDLLVAPVVEPDSSAYTVYLPPGNWIDFWTGQPITGGQTIHCDVPLSAILVYVKQGASIPMYLPQNKQLGDPVGNEAHREPTMYLHADGQVKLNH